MAQKLHITSCRPPCPHFLTVLRRGPDIAYVMLRDASMILIQRLSKAWRMRLVAQGWDANCRLQPCAALVPAHKIRKGSYRAQYHRGDALLTATTSLLATSNFGLYLIISGRPSASIMAPRDNQGNGGDEPKPEKSIATLSTLR